MELFWFFSRSVLPIMVIQNYLLLPFSDKGIILLLILVTYHTQCWIKWFTSELRVRFLGKGSEKGVIHRS